MQEPTDENTKKGTTAEQPATSSDTVVGDVPVKAKASIVLPVMVAVLIAAGLVGIGFIAYNAKDAPKPTPEQQTGVETLDHTSPVDETAVDNETAEIDKLEQDLDNGSDFGDDNINDESLGI